jgi:outer membrane protein
LENNGFLSRERAEQAQQKLAKKEQELQELETKLTQDIMLENQKLNVQLADSLTNYLKEFNADGRYHVILSNTAKDNVLMAAEQYDITDEVVAGLNARCKK